MNHQTHNSVSFQIEREYASKGFKIIAGVDEAGRGALAGPLVVGLAIYSASFISDPSLSVVDNIRDSKKLSPQKRLIALDIIKKNAKFALTTIISHRIIDKYNINIATEYAVKRLLKKMKIKPDIILMDGNFAFNVGLQIIPVIKGDLKSISIASASILAKVKRDSIIERFDSIYPGYYFNRNKGYPTNEHKKAIEEIGPSPIHRRTYQPVKSLVMNNSLFYEDRQ